MKRLIVLVLILLLCAGCAKGAGLKETTESAPVPTLTQTQTASAPAATEAPTTAAPTATVLPTEAPTTEAPTTAVPTEAPTTTVPETEPAPEIDRRAEGIYLAHPELTPVNYDSPALLPISEDAGDEYLDRITFVCDSPTYWMWPNGLLNGGKDTKQIWTGPQGTMTLAYLRGFKILDPFDKVERTIAETAALHTPDTIVIALGINGIAFMDEEYFKREYANLIDELQAASPETQIILQSMYPILPSYKHWGQITNASITLGNSWILQLAEQYGLPYLDTFSALVGEDGNARDEWMQNDGLHPNKAGLTEILAYIRTHAYLPEK